MRWCLFPFFLYIIFARLLKETKNKILRDICNFARTTNRRRGFHKETPLREDRNHCTGAKVIHYYNTYSYTYIMALKCAYSSNNERCGIVSRTTVVTLVSIPLPPPPSSIFFCLRSIILCYSI